MCPNSDMKRTPSQQIEAKQNIDPKIQNEIYGFQIIIFVPDNKKDETCRENKERDSTNEKEKKVKNLRKSIRFVYL